MLSRLLSPLFRFFEERVNPYPEGEVTTPPKGLLPFIWHFSRPVWPWLLVMSLITAVVSAAEVVFFSYMGDLVDWLGGVERAEVDEHALLEQPRRERHGRAHLRHRHSSYNIDDSAFWNPFLASISKAFCNIFVKIRIISKSNLQATA